MTPTPIDTGPAALPRQEATGPFFAGPGVSRPSRGSPPPTPAISSADPVPPSADPVATNAAPALRELPFLLTKGATVQKTRAIFCRKNINE